LLHKNSFVLPARAFVSKHEWQGHAQVAGHHMQITMATAIRGNFDAHFAHFRRSKLNIFDDERFPSLIEHCGFHS
jgi:hypothetical protein